MAVVEQCLERYESGQMKPPPERVELRPLPEGASGAMRAVYEFYGLVLSLRVDAGMRDAHDVLFACGWVADKIGRPKRTVHWALGELVKAGVLQEPKGLPKSLQARSGKRPPHTYAPVPVRHLAAVPNPKQDENETERRAAA